MSKLIPINEYKWTDDYSWHRTLTCVNHQDAVYYTKNFFMRSVILVKVPSGDIERLSTGECACPVTDLRVVEELKGTANV